MRHRRHRLLTPLVVLACVPVATGCGVWDRRAAEGHAERACALAKSPADGRDDIDVWDEAATEAAVAAKDDDEWDALADALAAIHHYAVVYGDGTAGWAPLPEVEEQDRHLQTLDQECRKVGWN